MLELDSGGPLPLPMPAAMLAAPAGLPMSDTATWSVADVFTLQWCHALADELSARTQWPVVVVGDGPSGHVGWVHAGVRMPDGRILDVEGAHDPGDWLDQWGSAVDEFGRDYMDQMGGDYDDDAVDIYETYHANSDGDFGALAAPPPQVLELAARTADHALAELGWTPPADPGSGS